MIGEINGAIPMSSLSASLVNEPQMGAEFTPEANVHAAMTPGGIIMNDYRMTVSDIERGKRLEVKRGAEIQNMDILDGVGITEVTITEVV